MRYDIKEGEIKDSWDVGVQERQPTEGKINYKNGGTCGKKLVTARARIG
jgi:hypothetical protein